MPLLPRSLRRNESFQADFRRLATLEPAVIRQLIDVLRPGRDSDYHAIQEIIETATDREAKDAIEASAEVLNLLISRSDAVPEAVADVRKEIVDLAERARVEVSEAQLLALEEGLERRATARPFLADTPDIFERFRGVTCEAFGIARRSRTGNELHVGLQMRLHYHDADDRHHEVEVALSADAAKRLLEALQFALEDLEDIRATGSISIAAFATSQAGPAL